MKIRYMLRKDVRQCLEIEELCFEYGWEEEDFVRCLKARNVIGLVVEDEEEILAYAIYELHANYIHLINLAVAPYMHGRGIGRNLVEKVIGKLDINRRDRIVGEVQESNLPAQLFFKALGFECTQIMKDYYDDVEDDAYVFQFRSPALVES